MDTKPTPAPPSPPPPPPVPGPASAAASALGRRAAGVPKRYSAEELDKRRAAMNAINARKVQVAKGTVKRLAVSSGKVRNATPEEITKFGRR